MWQWIIVQVVIAVISYLLQPKPQNSSRSTAAEFDVPTVKEGTSIPILFGTRDQDDIAVVCYGKVKAKKVTVSAGGKK